MKHLICGAVLAGVVCVAAEVNPVACWDGDFSEKTKSGVTLSVGDGNAEAADSGSITISSPSNIGVGLTWSEGLRSMTVMVKYSGLTMPAAGYRSFANAKTKKSNGEIRGDGSSPGVCCGPDGKTTGEWYSNGSTRTWTTSGVTEGVYPAGDGTGCFAFVYDAGENQSLKGVTLLKREADVWSIVYRAAGLLTSDDLYRIIGVTVGGPNADLSANSIEAFSGMEITGIAVFEKSLTSDELEGYCFPSDVEINTATLSSADAPYVWSELSWSLGAPPSKVTDLAVISVSGDVTLEMDESSPVVGEFSIRGNGSLKLTGEGRLGASVVLTEVPVRLGTDDDEFTVGPGIEFMSGGSLGNGSLATVTSGVVTGDVSGDGVLRVSSGRILFLGALDHTGGTVVEEGATAAVETGSFGSGAVSGSGVVCFRKVLPDESTRANFVADGWCGTCRLEALSSGIKDLDPNQWGTASSKVCFAGVPATTYFPGKTFEVKPEVILEDVTEDGVLIRALNVDNGYTDRIVTFTKLSGSGTFNAYYSTTPAHLVRVRDGSDFHGSIRVQKLRIVFGTGDFQVKPASGDCGQIIVSEGVSMDIAKEASWFSSNNECGVFIFGKVRCCTGEIFAYDRSVSVYDQLHSFVRILETGTLEMYMTQEQNQGIVSEWENTRERNRDYSRISGNGRIVLTNDGDADTWRSLPASERMWASTLSVSNAQKRGLLLLSGDTATYESPRVYEISNLSGDGDFMSNQTPLGENRSLRVMQSVSTVWSGAFDSVSRNDNVVGLSVAGVDGAESKTLTLTGENICTNVLTVEAGGSVRLDGTWVGDVSVSGDFGGSGRQKDGTVTFSAGSSLVVDAVTGGLGLSRVASWPTAVIVEGVTDASPRRIALLTSEQPLPSEVGGIALTVEGVAAGYWRLSNDGTVLNLRRNAGLVLTVK